jgi:hypothetical protein
MKGMHSLNFSAQMTTVTSSTAKHFDYFPSILYSLRKEKLYLPPLVPPPPLSSPLPLIAIRFWNSTSSILIAALAAVGYMNLASYKERRMTLLMQAFFTVGLGSVLFHGTLRHKMQLLGREINIQRGGWGLEGGATEIRELGSVRKWHSWV